MVSAFVADGTLPQLVTSATKADILVESPNGLNELPERHFEFPFILIGKSTMAILTSQSWCILKSWNAGGGPGQRFWRCFADGLNQRFSFVCYIGSQARI